MQVSPEVLIGSTAGIIGSALYAISVVIYRSQSEGIRPLAISSVKMWIALPVMAALLLIPGIPSPLLISLESTILLVLSITLGAVIGDTVYLISQERIGVSYAFPIAMSFPILTYFLTIVFLNEAFIITRLIGVFIAVAGVILISREQSVYDETEEIDLKRSFDMIGVFLAIITAILYAVGTTILQVGMEGVDSVSGNFIRVLAGSVAFVPLYLGAKKNGMNHPSKRALKLVAVAGFFGMGIGSVLYVFAVKYAGAAIMSVIASSAPLYAIPVSVFYLKERITKLAGIGVMMTVIGVILVILGI